MKATRADWAAQCPYSGIQDLPALLERIGESGIQISDVDGLQAALDALAGGGGGTVTWGNITGKPSFGSAAYVSVDQFLAAPTARTYQRGQIDFVMGQQSYPVVFSEEMREIPDVETQMYIADGTSEEMFFNAVQAVDTEGFTFWLDHAPADSRGYCIWRAKMPEMP